MADGNLWAVSLSYPAMEPIPMPRVMRWLLAVLAAQLVVDLAVLTLGDPASSSLAAGLELGALLVDAGVLLMLVRATELTRALIRGAAFAGMAIDAWILLGGLTYAPRDPEGVLMVASSAGLVAASAFAWLVLGRQDVKAWIFARWLRARTRCSRRVDRVIQTPRQTPHRIGSIGS